MSPPIFTGSKVEEDPQNFIDEIWKILKVMHATETEGVELATYQLKDVAHIWYEQWEESREIVLDMRSKTRKFFSGLRKHVKKEYMASVLINDIDISRIMVILTCLSSARAPALKNTNDKRFLNFKVLNSQSQGSVAQGSTRNPSFGKSGRIYLGVSRWNKWQL
ncbi:hypothetical protein H5410_014635 [Solanum commersonii]|uniref:Gag-pol polyprotein n=1 Tax=Solanum commersonii TaxID=4109 RepID=A0A9J5ZRS9_SOLCO|nr:hypothetical protein H5410_014635 [Solanum commersonii]